MKTKLNQTDKAAEKAIKTYGAEMCVLAYNLNVNQGEGGTVIEINTGIPSRSQGPAIRAGERLVNATATN